MDKKPHLDPKDDINIASCATGYSAVLDTFASADVAGYDVDLSFSGDTSAALNLHNLLDKNTNGSVSGTLSGQIVAVPEPLSLFCSKYRCRIRIAHDPCQNRLRQIPCQ